MDLRPGVAAAILVLGTGMNWLLHSPGNPNAGTSDLTGVLSASSVDSVVYVDGVKYAKTATGIQQAINDAPSGGVVFLPPSSGYTFRVSDTCINVTKPLTIKGAGLHGGSNILVAAAVGATQDIFCVTPTSDGEAIRFSDFEILPISGTPARYAFHLNGVTANLQHFSIERVEVLQLGSNAVFAEGSGAAQGTPSVSDFNHNTFYGGMVFVNAGDTIRIKDNQLTGTGKLDFAFQPGSSTLIIEGNNITVDGGIHIAGIANQSGIACQIIENEIETFVTFTGSNGALVDLDGIAGSRNADCTVARNSFQVVNGITANGLRVNYADRTHIYGNRFSRGAGASKDILITANASGTFIGTNMWASGTPFSSMVSDAGADTAFFTEFHGGPLLANNKFFWAIDNAGVQRPIFLMDTSGSVNYYGYHSNHLLVGVNGASYIYDGTSASNIAGAFSNGYPSAAVAGTAKLGGVVTAFSTKSSPYTLLSTDRWINVTGNTTITVPHAFIGQSWVVFNSGAATVTVRPDNGKINGAASITLAANTGKEITCDGTNCWAR